MTNRWNFSEQPTRLPVVVRAGDLQALADRLEEQAGRVLQDDAELAKDMTTAARLARHAARIWVCRSAVSIA